MSISRVMNILILQLLYEKFFKNILFGYLCITNTWQVVEIMNAFLTSREISGRKLDLVH